MIGYGPPGGPGHVVDSDQGTMGVVDCSMDNRSETEVRVAAEKQSG